MNAFYYFYYFIIIFVIVVVVVIVQSCNSWRRATSSYSTTGTSRQRTGCVTSCTSARAVRCLSFSLVHVGTDSTQDIISLSSPPGYSSTCQKRYVVFYLMHHLMASFMELDTGSRREKNMKHLNKCIDVFI